MKLVYLIIGACVIMSVWGAGCVSLLPAPQPNQPTDNYDEQIQLVRGLVLGIDTHISDLSSVLLAAAASQSGFSADSPEVIANLSDLYVHNPSSASVYRINADNVVVASVPKSASYRIGYQIPPLGIDLVNRSTSIYLTTYQRESTGETDVSVVTPVYTKNGTYDGFISFVLNPRMFFGSSLSDVPREGVTVLIMDKEGNVLYSDDTKRIGQNALQMANASDQDDMVALMTRMLSEKNGTVTYTGYSFGNMKYVTLASAWDTAETDYGPLTVMVGKKTTEHQLVQRPSSSTDRTLEEFVQSAYLYAVKNGKDAAVAAFNDPNSQFVTQEYTVTAVAINGTILANSMLPGDVGANQIAHTDANGVPTIRTLIQRAKQGGGYAMYLHPDPMHDQRMEVKLSYVLPVDSTWFIVSGKYMEEKARYVDPQLRDAMIEYTRQVAQYAAANGKDAAIAALNTPNGQFYREDVRLIAVDSDGTILARPYNPELIGTNVAGITDVYGGSLGRDLMTMAGAGGGMMYQYYPNQYTNENDMTLIYVLPVDDTWFLSSGIPMTAAP